VVEVTSRGTGMKIVRTVSLTLLLFSLVATPLLICSCDSAANRAKKIVSLRTERKQLLDILYKEYGGSELAQSVTANLQNEGNSGNDPGMQIVQGLANMTQGVDRSLFDQGVRTVGRGEELVALTNKSKQFFTRQDVIKRAKRVYEIDLELEMLENKDNSR
jgi:hypothetical protein